MIANEAEHAHIMSYYGDGFRSRKKRPPLSLVIEPAAFEYSGQRT